MAIKLPDPGNGIPEQKTGNDEWTNMKIVRDNFADQSNAASRLVGIGNDLIPTGRDAFSAAFSSVDIAYTRSADEVDFNTLPVGKRIFVIYTANMTNGPQGYGNTSWVVETSALYSPTVGAGATGGSQQIAYGYGSNVVLRRATLRPISEGTGWSAWQPIGTDRNQYTVTTATAPNLTIEADGTLKRASSSIKYKEVISRLELDDDKYNQAMKLQPVVYHSKSEGDPKDWHFLSFIAEEMAEIDPSFTQWKTHDFNEDGQYVELEEKEAEGINLNAICAALHATNIYQDKKLKELEKRLSALEG